MAATYPDRFACPYASPVSAIHIPGYEVVDVIGRGGFGGVYRARQAASGREVAVKVDSRVLIEDRDQRRFLREVRTAAQLSAHPHVVETYDAGILPDARPYLVMELCPDGSLAARAPLPPREVAEVGQRIADALAAAHDLGVLHRDIKPGNLLVKPHGTVGLADFGLAAVIEAGRDASATLNPAYVAPEAFHECPPTQRSDVYALTATLYALVAGFPPRFRAEGELSVPEIVRRHGDPVEDVAGVSPEFMAVLRRGLAKDPADRYPDAVSLRADLSQLNVGDLAASRHVTPAPATAVVDSSDPSAPPGRTGERAAAPAAAAPEPRHRTVVVVTVLVAALVLLAVAWFLLGG
jgi:serine/threonine protein kinase